MNSPSEATAFLLTFSFLSETTSARSYDSPLSATSFPITVECLTSCPKIEHSLSLRWGLLTFLSSLVSKVINAELMSLLATLEFKMMDSKYTRTLSLSLTVPLLAMALYTSCRWLSISTLSIFDATYSLFHTSNGKSFGLNTSSPVFSISLFPIIGFTAVSELWISNWSIVFKGTFVCVEFCAVGSNPIGPTFV